MVQSLEIFADAASILTNLIIEDRGEPWGEG